MIWVVNLCEKNDFHVCFLFGPVVSKRQCFFLKIAIESKLYELNEKNGPAVCKKNRVCTITVENARHTLTFFTIL